MKHILFLLFAIGAVFAGRTEWTYFEGRSGDVIVHPVDRAVEASWVVLPDGGALQTELELQDTDVAAWIAHRVGGPVMHGRGAVREAAGGSIFDKARANLLIVADGVGDVQQYDFLEVLRGNSLVGLRSSAYPQDSAAMAATLSSGYSPSVHGVVGKTWDGVEAFKAQALPKVASTADVVSQAFGGRSMVVSVSGDFQLAAAHGVHQFLQTEQLSSSNVAVFYNQERRAFQSIYESSVTPQLNMTKSQILDHFRIRSFPRGVHYVDTQDFLVDIPEQNTKTSFDLSKVEDFLFFAELELLLTLVDELESNPEVQSLAKDEIPDLFTFTFSSFQGLKSRYGSDSQEFKAALLIFDAVVQQVVPRANAVYQNKLATEIIFAGQSLSSEFSQDAAAKMRVYNLVRKDVRSKESFEDSFPSIYLLPSSDKSAVCDRLKSGLDFEVYCPETFTASITSRMELQQSGNGTVPSTGGLSPAQTFQTVLWTSIILVLVGYLAIYTMFSMDTGSDSMLYSSAAPKSHAS